MQFKINIPADVNKLIRTLQNNGHTAYVVGGCVRDSILGRKPHDWDICTSATPSEMLKIFKGERIIETGLQHGTVIIVVNGDSYEITTYRIDGIYSDNRRPDEVIFSDSIKEDLRRRDFTMNAMAYNDEEGLVDPYNGLQAIESKKVECVGSAKERFGEDALRILRAIRFASQLEFIILPGTDWEIHQQYKSLSNISVERINSEFCKIALSEDFCVQMVLYEDVFGLFIPEIKDMFEFPQNNPYHIYDVYTHTVLAIEHCDSDDLVVRLAVFFHDIGKPHSFQDGEDEIRHFKGHGRVSASMTDVIMRRLKFDNDTREKVIELICYHDSSFEVGAKYIKRWLNKIGEKQFRRLLELRKADVKAQNPIYMKERLEKITDIENTLENILIERQCFTMGDLVISGNDVMQIMKIKEGKDVGRWLKEILNRVIDGRLKNNRDELIYWMTGITDGWIKF